MVKNIGFFYRLEAFKHFTMGVRRALCAVMVFAVVEKAGTVVMNDNEELDSWSVIINGEVQINTAAGINTHSLSHGPQLFNQGESSLGFVTSLRHWGRGR